MKRMIVLTMTLCILLASFAAISIYAEAIHEDEGGFGGDEIKWTVSAGVVSAVENAIGDVKVPDEATELGAGLFKNNVDVTAVRIPATVTKIASDAFEGCTALKDIYFGGSLSDWTKMGVTVSGATMHYAVAIVYGDCNGDGNITSADLMMLKRYIANYDSTTGKSTIEVGAGADCNGDGSITSADLMMLKRYIANYDSTTGTSTIELGPKK